MRVVLVNCAHQADLQSANALLDRYRTLTGWASALRRRSIEVVVVQGWRRDEILERDGVRYELVAGRFTPQLAPWHAPTRLHRRVAALAPDVVHLNGMLYAPQAGLLRRSLSRSRIVLQHHAGRPARGPWSLVERWGLGAVDGLVFTAREQVEPWRRRGLLRPRHRIFEIMEGASELRPGNRGRARDRTGFVGDPQLLWVGHLDRNKDPLCVLDGFARILPEHPNARLAMVFQKSPLLANVRARLAEYDRLARAVELIGEVHYDEIAPYFHAADLFLLGSHAEGSGYALADALACGVVPVVSDIPSFRAMTGRGAVGGLWRPGDPEALARALREVLSRDLEPQRDAALRRSEETLSWPAIGQQVEAAYRELLAARH